MNYFKHKKLLFWMLGIAGVLLILLVIAVIRYWCWSPGSQKPLPAYPDNAIWLERGWLGDDGWFRRHSRNPEDFRSEKKNHCAARITPRKSHFYCLSEAGERSG